MNHPSSLNRAAAAVAALLLACGAIAAPGAHGPNGEHLDGAAQQASAGTAPKLEAKSELFELVATLSGGELSILVDRFDTNEPVLNANVEVEVGNVKAIAKFHADNGNYAVDQPALLQLLAKPGEHALVFTIAAAKDTDLLDGTLRVSAPAADDHGHGHWLTARNGGLAAGALLALGAIGAFFWRRRRNAARGAR